MNRRQIDEVREAGITKLKTLRAENGKDDSLVGIIGRQDSIPRALVMDREITASAVRAFCVLTTYCPTIFPGMRSLGRILGGVDGAVRTTDELFFHGWISKEIIREGGEKKQILGTIYLVFPRKFSVKEMAELGVGWCQFVARLAQPSKSGKDKKASLRRKAAAVVVGHPEIFGGVFPFSESDISESEKGNERFIKEEGFFNKKFCYKETGGIAAVKEEKGDGQPKADRLCFENEYGFAWTASHDRLIDESRACAIMKQAGIKDAGLARRIIAEWTVTVLKNPSDPARALVWACRTRLTHTSAGDKCLPTYR